MRFTASTFTRPGDTNAYAAGDLVANSTTAGSVVPLSFVLPQQIARSCMITGFSLVKSGATVTNAAFGLHLFSASPTIATTGDNGVFASVVSGASDAFLYMEFSSMKGYADGGRGHGVPTDANFRPSDLGAITTIYGLLEARAAYTPANAETFTPEIFVLPV